VPADNFVFKIEVTIKNTGEDEASVERWLVSHIYEIPDVEDVSFIADEED